MASAGALGNRMAAICVLVLTVGQLMAAADASAAPLLPRRLLLAAEHGRSASLSLDCIFSHITPTCCVPDAAAVEVTDPASEDCICSHITPTCCVPDAAVGARN